MYNGIDWLPEIIDDKDFQCEEGINYSSLIETAYTYFVMDFCNPTSPILFKNKKVVICEKLLDCFLLKIKDCYNSMYYNCPNCNFQNKFDIFNHISTDDYYLLHKKNPSINVPKLKVKKRNRKIPRTPGQFNLERLKRIVWIKAIIENCNDTKNVKIYENTFTDKNNHKTTLIDVTFVLKQEKYKIAIEPIIDKQNNTIKYYVLKTAFYMN